MFQVPATIWQKIAATGPKPTSRWGEAMAGGQPAIDKLLSEVDKEQEAQGIPNRVTLAFQMTAPLLVENDRIMEYLCETDRHELTQVLLDLPTPEVAADVGALEYPMTADDREVLEALLVAELEWCERVPSDNRKAAGGAYELRVDRAQLLEGLRALRLPRYLPSRARCTLGFDGERLSIGAFDQMFLAHAEGAWPGNAVVSATLVAALKSATPPGDPLNVRCDGSRLSIGALAIDCEWQPVSQALMNVPGARDWLGYLALRYMWPPSRIGMEGYADEVEDAERRLFRLLARIAKLLAPLGVTSDDLRVLVEAKLQERYLGSEPEGDAPPSQS